MKTFVLLLMFGLLPSAGSVTNSAVLQSPVSFAGTWKTIAGGANQYTVILKQVGNTVTGTYSPGNGKIFGGVVTGNKLTFKWTQDGGFEGTAEFTMNEDGKGFTGSSNAIKPKEFTVSWDTYVAPVASFAGTWETISNNKNSISLTMVQTGNTVTGVYPGNNGKIEGTVTGKVLRFKWQSDGGGGSGRFVIDDSGQAFSGTYNRGNDPDEVDFTWNGKRPVSFAGVWKLTFASTSLTMYVQQSGNEVTGQIEAVKAEVPIVAIREGVVVGNTLRFKAGRDNDSDPTTIEFVMDEGGKSFRGRIGDGFVAGSFLKATLPSLFGGAWQAKWGESSMQLILNQGASRVTGQINVNSAQYGMIVDGIVDGNTLRFKVIRLAKTSKQPEELGTGELVMDKDGKSFSGTVLGADTSGTLVGR